MRKLISLRIGIAVLGLAALCGSRCRGDEPAGRSDGDQGPAGRQGARRGRRRSLSAETSARVVGQRPSKSRAGLSALVRPLVVASFPCRSRSICSTSPIGSAGSSGCWRSWALPSSSRITAGRSRAASCSGGWPCSGGSPSSSCGFPPASICWSRPARRSSRSWTARSREPGSSSASALVDPKGPAGFVFAFRVLPTVIFVAALFAVLYHLGVMQWVVRGFAVVMAWLMGTSGAESLNVAASLFLGQTEAPLTIRPYLPRLTRSELLTVMTSGMAHVSGGVMAAYIAFGIEARHILTAVIMTAPGAILLSKMLVPETGQARDPGHGAARPRRSTDANVLDAASRGTRDGLHLALNIAAMLISFLGLVALVNMGLALRLGTSLQGIVGWAMAPGGLHAGRPLGRLQGRRQAARAPAPS